MRGLHTSLVIVVAAIVILIVALIVLTIFGVGIGGVASYLDQANICCTKFSSTCTVTGSPPADWNVKLTVMKNGNPTALSCADLTTLKAGDTTVTTAACKSSDVDVSCSVVMQ